MIDKKMKKKRAEVEKRVCVLLKYRNAVVYWGQGESGSESIPKKNAHGVRR